MYTGSLALAGEFMCSRPFSMHDEPEFLDLIKLLRDADTTYCHLEMNFLNKDATPGRPAAPQAMWTDPVVANELKWAGVDLVSSAYNHVLDWGYDSVFDTIEWLDKAGIVHSGSGANLEEAREPAYFESKAGRVAIISMSSGHHPYDSAVGVKAPVRGKPGVNPLRVTQKYVVTQDDFDKLQGIWKRLGLQTSKPFSLPGEPGDNFLVAGDYGGGHALSLILRIGDKPDILSIPNKYDVEANIRAVKDAKRQADIVIVAHHAAVNEGKREDKPPKFMQPLARSFIDAGADFYVTHGWHRLLGIEIYKGKPIWYGTGNFFAQSHFLQRYPASIYEGHGFDMDDLWKYTPADLTDDHQKNMANWKEQPGGAIVTLNMKDGKFSGMKLHPFSMGYEQDKGPTRITGNKIDGRPMLTYGENAKRIIDFVKKLSAPYNTNIEYKDGIGEVTLE